MPTYDPKQGPLLIEYPLVGGIDQKTDPRKVDQAKLLRAENAQIDKTGLISKRFGTTSIGVPNASGSRLAQYRSNLVAISAGVISEYEPALGTWLARDQVPEVTDTRQTNIYAGNDSICDASMAYESVSSANGTFIYTWRTLPGLSTAVGDCWVKVVDAVTGQTLSGPTLLITQIRNPKVVTVGSRAIVTWIRGANVAGMWCDLTSYPHTWSSEVIMATNSGSNCVYDICPINSTYFMMAYEESSGTNRLNVGRYSNILGLSGAASMTDAVSSRKCIALQSTVGERCWVAYSYVTGGQDVVMLGAVTDGTSSPTESVVPYLISGITTTDAPIFNVGVCRLSSTTASVVWGMYGTTTAYDMAVHSGVGSTSALVGTNRITYGVSLGSKPFVNGTKIFCLLYVFQQGTQGSIILADVNADDTSTAALRMRPVAVASPRQSPVSFLADDGGGVDVGKAPIGFGVCPSVITDASGVVHTTAMTGTGQFVGGIDPLTLRPNAQNILMGLSDMAFTFDYKKRMTAELGDLLYISGGIVNWYDGTRSAEVSFLWWPEYVSSLAPSTIAGTHLTLLAAYAYKLMFVQRDANGNYHRSETSRAISAARLATTENCLTFTTGAGIAAIPYLGLTSRQDAFNAASPVGMEIYRTTGLNGTVYFKLNAEPLPVAQLNSTASYFWGAEYVDSATDASLSGRQILYTFGSPVGQLSNMCPPGASIICTHRGRIWLAGCPNRKELWASKQFTQGEAPGFSDGLVFYLDDGGDITGLASMDDKLIVFKEDKIFVITGDGPDDTGQNSDWSQPIRVVTTVGCIEPRSVVMTPLGVVYQSRVGLSLLTRGLDVVPDWGVEVEDSILANPTITSAVVHKTRMEVRWTCMSSSTTGIELRYDYRTKQWFTTKYYDAAADVRPVSACTVGTAYYWQNAANGKVFKEDSSTYLDTSTYVSMLLEFADLKLGGTVGYQNAMHLVLLADWKTGHELKLEYAIDGGSYATGKQWTAAQLAALSREQLDYHLTQTKNQAVRIRLSDLTPTSGSVGTGQGYSLAGLSFEAVPLPGRNRNIVNTAKG